MPGESTNLHARRTFMITIAIPGRPIPLCNGSIIAWQRWRTRSGLPSMEIVVLKADRVVNGIIEPVVVVTGDIADSPASGTTGAEEDVLNSLADFLLGRLGCKSARVEYGDYSWDRRFTHNPLNESESPGVRPTDALPAPA